MKTEILSLSLSYNDADFDGMLEYLDQARSRKDLPGVEHRSSMERQAFHRGR